MAVINNLTKRDIQGKIESLRNPKQIETMTRPELVFFVHNNQFALYPDGKKFAECAASITELRKLSFEKLYTLASEIAVVIKWI